MALRPVCVRGDAAWCTRALSPLFCRWRSQRTRASLLSFLRTPEQDAIPLFDDAGHYGRLPVQQSLGQGRAEGGRIVVAAHDDAREREREWSEDGASASEASHSLHFPFSFRRSSTPAWERKHSSLTHRTHVPTRFCSVPVRERKSRNSRILRMPAQQPAPVPVVDLASPTAASDLASATSTLGCAFLVNHGVSEAVQDALFTATASFFAQLPHLKARLAADSNFRGFTPLGDEALALAETAGDTAGAAAPAVPVEGDRKEGLYFGRDLPPDHPLPLHGPNRWPDGLPGFREAVENAQAALEAAAERLVPLIGAGLGPEAQATFETAFLTRPRRAMAFLRPLHYPPLPASEDAPSAPSAASASSLGAGAHTDYGFLTLLLVAGGAPGLEIELPASLGGGWAAVQAPAEAAACPSSPSPSAWPLFFNAGDMLHRWSSGRYASAKHRVVAPGPGDPPRFSAAFFYDPPGDCVCAPIVKDGEVPDPRWPAVRYLDYLQARFGATHASYAAATGGGDGT